MSHSLDKQDFQSILLRSDLSRQDKLLTILYWDGEKTKSRKAIQEISSTHGLRECQKWNVSDILARAKPYAISTKEGWSLTIAGKEYLRTKKIIVEKKSVVKNDIEDIRLLLPKIKNPDIVSFLEEALSCLETNQKRAAVVFSWIGAVAILHDHVINHHLTAFNTEAIKRDPKWKPAKNSDDLGRMKEHDFLNILESLSILGKNVKQELQNCLQLRNGCGHPNSLSFGLRKVSAHLETLILNVYSKF